MELIVRNLGSNLYSTTFGERLYHSNFKPMFSTPHQTHIEHEPFDIQKWHSDEFNFSASVSGIYSRIKGAWKNNILKYSIGDFAELTLELAPVAIATLSINDSVHTLHATQLRNEVLLGVGGILDHSYHQMPSLHASAVLYKGEAILFIGESGQGKSTLAKKLNGLNEIFSLSDDMSLIDVKGRELVTNVPQLKVEHHYYPAARNKARYPIKAVMLLTEPSESVYINDCPKPQNLLRLMRHTACVRLMPKQMQAQLLTLYGTAFTDVPFFELHYPRKMAIFENVADELKRTLEKI